MAETTPQIRSSLLIVISGLMTALTAAATIIVSIYIPGSGGFFNTGESLVYTTAILFGPFVGAFAGGVGSMMADIYLGFDQFAPGTLLIKGCEGFIVGSVVQKLRRLQPLKQSWISILLSLSVSALLAIIGTLYYTGEAYLLDLTLVIPTYFWILLAIPVGLMIYLLYQRSDLHTNIKIIAILLGGSIMVPGYFLYEFYPLGYGYQAFVEIPFNILQVIVGLIIALPVTRTIERSLGDLIPLTSLGITPQELPAP
jgi:uncharacterized membrane protein